MCVSPITGLGCLWHCPEKSTPHVHRAGKQTLTYAWLLRSELQEGNGAAPASKRPKQPQEAASAGAECLQAEPVPIKYTWPCYSWDTDRVCAPGKCVPGSASQQTQRDCCPYPDLLRIRHNSHPLQLSNQPSSDVSRGTAVSGGKRWRFLPPWKGGRGAGFSALQLEIIFVRRSPGRPRCTQIVVHMECTLGISIWVSGSWETCFSAYF